jgi:hypothetical protein
MTPGDTLPPHLPTHRTPLFRRGSSGGCRNHPPRGGFFRWSVSRPGFTARPRMGGRRAVGRRRRGGPRRDRPLMGSRPRPPPEGEGVDEIGISVWVRFGSERAPSAFRAPEFVVLRSTTAMWSVTARPRVRVSGGKAANWSSGGMMWTDECRKHVDRVSPVIGNTPTAPPPAASSPPSTPGQTYRPSCTR